MNFNEILVEIMLSDKNDRGKDIDWLYGEYVRRGYEKSKEKFYEEIVKNMGEQELSDLTELEETEVVGGAGKLKNRSVGVALAGALLAGTLMPSQQAQARRQEETNTTYLSNRKKETSTQGIADKAKKIVNKFLNDEDTRKILLPTLTTLGIAVGGLAAVCIITKFVNYILEAKTPSEVIDRTVKKINDTLKQSDTDDKKQTILALLSTCLTTLLKFVKEEERATLENQCTRTFGTDKTPKTFNSLDEIQKAFTTQLKSIIQALQDEYTEPDTETLLDLLQNATFKEIFTEKETGEELKGGQPEEIKKDKDKSDEEKDERAGENIEEETERQATEETDTTVLLPNCESIFTSDYDVNMTHSSYTTDELKDNKNVSYETGIRKDVLDVVDTKMAYCPWGQMESYNLTKNVMLVVCKGMKIPETARAGTLQKLLRANPGLNLYLVLQDCSVDFTDLIGIKVTVLDLRGTTGFAKPLWCKGSLGKVMLRNQQTSKNQLWLCDCPKLGPIYQMAENNEDIMAGRVFLYRCHFDANFKWVNLNQCCNKLMEERSVFFCTCPAKSRNNILKSFDHPEALSDESRIKDV